MKIIKHEFEIPQLTLIDGELVESDPIKETCTFTLLHGGVGVFETNYGCSLLGSLMAFGAGSGTEEERAAHLMKDGAFIRELAAASYVKIENGKFENTHATAQEFKEKDVANYLYDVSFVMKLIRMACDCVVENKKQNPKKVVQEKK